MALQKRASLSAMVLVLTALFAVGMAVPAQAAASSSVWVDTSGSRAAEALFNRSNGTHANKAWIDINDTKCDASPAILRFKISGEPQERSAKADGGCGTSAGVNLKTGYFTIKYRVCVKTGVFSEKCSDTRSDHN
jgi:hypothetical protein